MKKRGLLIVFEGLDRVGKTTQVKLLEKALVEMGHEVINQRFPDRTTETGKVLNQILTSTKNMDIKASHLLFSFNRWEKQDEMYNSLVKEGKTIIVDRYAFSGVAYSVANGAPVDYCMIPDQGLLRPDLVIQLDMPIDEIKKRNGFGEEKYENEEIQTKVQQNFKLFHNKKYWNLINANQSMENIHNEIISKIKSLINKYSDKQINFETNDYPNNITKTLFLENDV
jgi:dTMP kinase